MNIVDPFLRRSLAQQIASVSGVEVVCGTDRAVPTEQEREQFRA